MRRSRLATLFVAASLYGCTSLPDIESDVCGNAVLEKGEDCDTFVDQPGTICRQAGAPGECRFDCRLNADRTRAECPTGFACADDGVCRRPNPDETYEAPEAFSTDVSSWVSSVDFDGDGRMDVISADPADLLGQARFRLHYFDASGTLSETRLFPRVTTRPVPRKSPSPRTDLIFSNGRIGMLPGRDDRNWVPAAFSSYTVGGDGMRVVSVYRDYVSWVVPFALVTRLERGPGIYVPSPSGSLVWRTALPGADQELLGDALGADLVPGSDSPCDELALAFRGQRVVTIFDLCEAGASPSAPPVVWREQPLEERVELPAEVEHAPLAADVDGDGLLDLLVGAGGRTYVAYGDGSRFREPSPVEVTRWVVRPASNALQLEPGWEVPYPLAAGDVSGDGIADFVLPIAVYTSRLGPTGEVTYFPAVVNRGAPWSMAHIADLNDNGLPDIVAAAEGSPGITLLNGTGGPYLVDATLPSHGPVRLLTTGDFDGDQITDLAFVESGPPPKRVDAVNVCFSARDGLPGPARIVAEMTGVQQLGRFFETGLDNLFVTTRETQGEAATGRFTLFEGDPQRLPLAPYSLVTFSVDMQLEQSQGLAVIAGSFSSPDSSDALAVGLGGTKGVLSWWLAPEVASGSQPPLRLTGELPAGAVPFAPEESPVLSIAGVAADVDGDGKDEALWLMPVIRAASEPSRSEAEESCVLGIYDVEHERGEPSGLVRLTEQIDLGAPCPDPQLAAGKLRVDYGELPDVVVSVGDPARSPRQPRVLLNDGRGGFSLENSTLVAVPERRDVRSFSLFPGRGLRIAYVTAKGLHLAKTKSDGRVYDAVEQLGRLDDGRSVAVTDINGDGFSDIVAADARGLWLTRLALE